MIADKWNVDLNFCFDRNGIVHDDFRCFTANANQVSVHFLLLYTLIAKKF